MALRRLGKLALGAAVVGAPLAFPRLEDEFWASKPNNGVVNPAGRKKVVVLGSGWAAVKFLAEIDCSKYDVVCVSPRNYFLFTPLLPSVTVGTLDLRSIVVPIRLLLSHQARPVLDRIEDMRRGYRVERPRFIEARCTGVDTKARVVTCEDDSAVTGGVVRMEYDLLIVAVGSTTNTFGTKGADQHCHFLKDVNDAVGIRHHVMDCLETANFLHSKEEKQAHLNFVVVGGGPTGVEFAAELSDFLRFDLSRLYPDSKLATVTVVQSASHILNAYDAQLSEYTEQLFRDNLQISVLTNSRVTEVRPGAVRVMDKATKQARELPFAVCVWAAGVQPVPLVQQLMRSAKGQNNRSALVTNEMLQVEGLQGVYALGDCATIRLRKMQAKAKELFKRGDTNKDQALSKQELATLVHDLKRDNPEWALHLGCAEELMEKYDRNRDRSLSRDEFDRLLEEADNHLKALPPTAQVAAQQGTYLAQYLNGTNKEGFVYTHKGQLAYVGSENAVTDVQLAEGTKVTLSGGAANLLWHAAYLDMVRTIGVRNSVLVSFDWAKVRVFGRDTSRF